MYIPYQSHGNHPRYATDRSLGVAFARGGAPGLQQVGPFRECKRAPLLRMVTTVAKGIAAPVGLACLVIQIIKLAAVRKIVIIAGCPSTTVNSPSSAASGMAEASASVPPNTKLFVVPSAQ